MLSPAGSLTVAVFSSGACGSLGLKTVLRSVGSLVCGKWKLTARPVGWSLCGAGLSWTGLTSRLGSNCEARAGSSHPVTGGVVLVAVTQAGSSTTGWPFTEVVTGRPLTRLRPGFSQVSVKSLQAGSASEQSTGFDANGASEVPEPCSEGTPKKVAEKILSPTRMLFTDPIANPYPSERGSGTTYSDSLVSSTLNTNCAGYPLSGFTL